MINIKDKITFFYAIEEKLWGDKVNANKYFATICILGAALLGAWHTAGSFMESAFGWAAEISIFYALMLVWYMWVINIAESVFACKDLVTATLRSLLILFSFVLAYVAGVILGTIVIIIVCVVLGLFALYIVLSMLSGSLNASMRSSSKSSDDDNYPTEDTKTGRVKVLNKSMDDLHMTDTDGHEYSRKSIWDRFERDYY